MRICRIKYTVLGLLVYYLQCAFTWSCASDFEDVASKTVTADVVFEGIPLNKMRLKNKPGYYYYRFALVSLIKGNFSKAYISSLQHLTKSTTSTVSTRSSSIYYSLANARSNHDSWSNNRVRHAQSNHQYHLNTYTHRRRNPRFDYSHIRPYRRRSKRSIGKAKKKRRIILVRQFGAREEVSECVAAQRMKRVKYLVFLQLPRRPPASQTTLARAKTTQHFKRARNLKSRSSLKHRIRLKRRIKNHRNNWQSLSNGITTNKIKKRKRKIVSPKIYSLSSMPVLSSETFKKIARNHNCGRCKRQARVVHISAARSVVLGDELSISCTVSGFPKPEVYWLKNGLVLTDDNIDIKPRRRNISTMRSTLVFKQVKESDTGQYQCYGVNVLGESPLVRTNITVVSEIDKPFSKLCETQHYCLNGGICYKLIDLNKRFCSCTEDFIGERCKERNTGHHVLLMGRRKRRRRSSPLRHHSNR